MKDKALSYLRTALDDVHAYFRDGQWECIEAIVRGDRQLVVQRTGWGKSMVYFLGTRLLRDLNRGPTLLISPLLSLMRNQVASAQRIHIRAATINSSNTEMWEEVEADLLANRIDVLLISPERLSNEGFRERILQNIAGRIGLFVVDEAHCISDWGHDFRPDYRRIIRVLQTLPKNIPVLATTATANDRVVRDVAQQLTGFRVTRYRDGFGTEDGQSFCELVHQGTHIRVGLGRDQLRGASKRGEVQESLPWCLRAKVWPAWQARVCAQRTWNLATRQTG